jgi:hypothetical protein
MISGGIRMESKWISVNDRLPDNKQKVLIVSNCGNCYPPINIDTAIFYKGNTREECERINRYGFADQFANNLVPYAWKGSAHMQWFGQEITHWMELPELPEE